MKNKKFTITLVTLGAVAIVLALLIIFLIKPSSCNKATSLSEVAFASAVDEATRKPVSTSSEFKSDQEKIYLTLKIENAKTEVKVVVKWLFVTSNFPLGEKEVAASGSRYLDFYIGKPNGGWPMGSYRADIYLGGVLVNSGEFKIIK